MAPRRKKSEVYYIVERIVDCKGEGKKKQYLIKWEGYPEESNTWEPPSCIIDKTLIQVFEQERLENAVTQDVAALDQRANEEKPERKRPRSVPSGNENGKEKPNARRKSGPAKAKHEKESKTSQESRREDQEAPHRPRTSVTFAKPTDAPKHGVKDRLKTGSGRTGSSSIKETLKKNQVAAPLGSKKQESPSKNRAPEPLRSKKEESPERNRAPGPRRSKKKESPERNRTPGTRRSIKQESPDRNRAPGPRRSKKKESPERNRTPGTRRSIKQESPERNRAPGPRRSIKQESPERNRAPGPRRSKKRRISESDVDNDEMDPTQAFKGEPEVILGATDFDFGPLHFLVQWKGQNRASLVPAEVANVNCPQLVIKYYKKCLRGLPAPGPEKSQ